MFIRVVHLAMLSIQPDGANIYRFLSIARSVRISSARVAGAYYRKGEKQTSFKRGEFRNDAQIFLHFYPIRHFLDVALRTFLCYRDEGAIFARQATQF